jgi:hypothetical protein
MEMAGKRMALAVIDGAADTARLGAGGGSQQ